MISSLQLSKIIKLIFFLIFLITIPAALMSAEDIWKKNESDKTNSIENNNEKKIKIKSPIKSKEIENITLTINEEEIDKFEQGVIGIFDPEKNDFTLDMWVNSNGEDIKKILKRINNIKLSKFSEDLLFQILFTNSYPPNKNLGPEEFLKIKIDWLINNKRFQDLEKLLNLNPTVGKQDKVIKLLVNEYLSSSDIKSACEKTNLLNKDIQNNYLDKFSIYCLVNQNRKEEAQLIFELLKERGHKDKFFEDKINFLLGLKDEPDEKIKDDNLLNFFLSHITIQNFSYKPDDKTDKYIWKYLSSANLIETKDFDDEETIITYEKAAAEKSLRSEEIFEIYKQILFNVNQLINSKEVYKNFPNYKARALIYQKILLSNDVETKLYFTFLLKELFEKDNLLNVYKQKLLDILNDIEKEEIPKSYEDTVTNVLKNNLELDKKIKFENDILHRSKVIKHFLDNRKDITKTEKDFKSVYKKIKRNKKYFISIKDTIVLESLQVDGVVLPEDLKFENLIAQLTVPKNLEEMVEKNQMGFVVLKIIEIIGEDKIQNLDPETIYFLSNILNQLKLKKIRNQILSEALPIRA